MPATECETLATKVLARKDDRQRRIKEHRAWEASLVGVQAVRMYFNATPTETKRWIGDGRIPTAQTRSFVKWGQHLKTTMHDPKVLAGLIGHVAAWRQADKQASKERRSAAAKASASDPAIALKRRLTSFCGAVAKASAKGDGQVSFNAAESMFSHEQAVPCKDFGSLPVRILIPLPEDIRQALHNGAILGKTRTALIARALEGIDAVVSRSNDALSTRTGLWLGRVASLMETYVEDGAELGNYIRQVLRTISQDRLAGTEDRIAEDFGAQLERALAGGLNLFMRDRGISHLRRETGLNDYASLFPTARAIERKFVLFLGPTNSGKTHAAMDRLARAATGVYLAPLRLMAMEGAERMTERGIPCNMITGEEEILVPGAQHVSSTIEMLDLSREVEVAVIDEIQLLSDRERGWAWTQAVIGVPAREIIMTGSADAIPIVARLAEMPGDKMEVRTFERKTPLSPLPEALNSVGELQPGDAVIAFSRAEVLRLREAAMAAGHNAATIYGALGPEVRRSEADRFRNGKAQIVVATDAIGMGLNLPIRRVVFSALRKYDGKEDRPLTGNEIRQIAGRAGRFGLADAGYAGVLGAIHKGPGIVAQALSAPPDPPKDTRPFVMPPWSAVSVISERMQTQNLSEILRHAVGQLLQNDPHLRGADLENALVTATAIERSGLPLRTRYAYIGCPIDERTDGLVGLVARWAVLHARGDKIAAPPAVRSSKVPSTHEALAHCETIVKHQTAYMWLSQRYPSFYINTDTARDRRSAANTLIEAALRQRALARTCKQCGGKLPQHHRFAICDGCHSQRWSKYDDDDFY